MDELKVLTLNTWGILYISTNLEVRMRELSKELAKGHYDLIGLQEVWSEKYYKMIADAVRDVLPYSHHFVSGFLGGGLAVFSRYPIKDTLFQPYSCNGKFWKFHHGDWYSGKGLSVTTIEHPKKTLYFCNTHLHASYPSDNYTECRALQIHEVSQILKHITRPDDAVIMVGDFNHTPEEFGVEALLVLTKVSDTYKVSPKKPSKCDTVTHEGRIDYVFINDAFECLSCDLACGQIPGMNLTYSDHIGYTATLKFKEGIACPQAIEDKTVATLKKMFDLMNTGEKHAWQLDFKALSLLLLFTCTLLLLPLLAGEFYYSVSSSLTTWTGKFIFIAQVVTSCLTFLFFILYGILFRQTYANGYRKTAAEINLKLKALQGHSNGDMKKLN